jgi:hypothetical protein
MASSIVRELLGVTVMGFVLAWPLYGLSEGRFCICALHLVCNVWFGAYPYTEIIFLSVSFLERGRTGCGH